MRGQDKACHHPRCIVSAKVITKTTSKDVSLTHSRLIRYTRQIARFTLEAENIRFRTGSLSTRMNIFGTNVSGPICCQGYQDCRSSIVELSLIFLSPSLQQLPSLQQPSPVESSFHFTNSILHLIRLFIRLPLRDTRILVRLVLGREKTSVLTIVIVGGACGSVELVLSNKGGISTDEIL